MKLINVKKLPGVKKTFILGIPLITRRNDGKKFYYDCLGVQVFSRKHLPAKQQPVATTVKKESAPAKITAPTAVNSSRVLDNNYLNIAVRLTGGLGDLLVSANYLHKLMEHLDSNQVRLYVFAHKDLNVARAVFRGMPFVYSLGTLEDIPDNDRTFDLFFEIQRYPFIRWQNRARIFRYSPKLIELVFLWERFRVENSRFWFRAPWFDGQNQLEIIKGRKRIQQPDVYGRLGLDESFGPKLMISKAREACLDKFDLNGKKFITIHRGVDTKIDKDSNKLWPMAYYNILISEIKKEFPEYLIVQLGANTERCPEMEGVDRYIAGKTDFDDLKILLKEASLHIDGEGGMVHLRHALHGGRSLVFFGPTSKSFYGYSENINLSGNGCGCKEGCEWTSTNWQSKCIAGYARNVCMRSLIPEVAVNSLKGILK